MIEASEHLLRLGEIDLLQAHDVDAAQRRVHDGVSRLHRVHLCLGRAKLADHGPGAARGQQAGRGQAEHARVFGVLQPEA